MIYNPQQGNMSVLLEVTGLVPGSVHPAHIHAGPSCTSNGPVLYPLPTLMANAAGMAFATTMINLRSVPATGLYVNVHQVPTWPARTSRPSPAAWCSAPPARR